MPETVFALTTENAGDDVLAHWGAKAAGAKLRALKAKRNEEEDVEDELVNQFNNTMNISKRRRVQD